MTPGYRWMVLVACGGIVVGCLVRGDGWWLVTTDEWGLPGERDEDLTGDRERL